MSNKKELDKIEHFVQLVSEINISKYRQEEFALIVKLIKKEIFDDMREVYLTPSEVSKQLNISTKTLANARSLGKGIDLRYIKFNTGTIRYRQSDVDNYMSDKLFGG